MNSKKEDHSREMSESDEIVFLTLGDGDFTWSLDLGRYLAHASSNEFGGRKRRLIASGIDTWDELSYKYRNSPFILREMKRLRDTSDESLTVEVQHGINAIVAHESAASSRPSKAHVVIFNHPHLGTEDAALHSQFLCHLFHSISQFWLLDSGVFHLTLVKGQFDRWECDRAAMRHGLVLLERGPFLATPSVISNPCYEHRRHQTGKSFASRTSGSETFTFMRESNATASNDRPQLPKLPWFTSDENTDDKDMKEQSTFTCSYCSKPFREERSLKNHLVSKHGSAQDKKRKRPDGTVCEKKEQQQFTCNYCETTAESRVFESTEALQSHIRAKHDAIHAQIPPDWSQRSNGQTIGSPPAPESHDFGTCSICGYTFANKRSEMEHIAAFVPSQSRSSVEVMSLQCRFCRKSFRQTRALLQHENFCSSRPEGVLNN